MLEQRYDLRRDPDGTWTVFDVFTGQPFWPDGMTAVGLNREYADDLVDLLNAEDLKSRLS
ncbi:hypothetical protein EN974_23480 [Mesorhizobium sp. M7A.F.Ca.CA.001.12.2.1]|nr:hypothetical protein EN974_23480 [Mesorhizobium sp. M7A.F.Ca.CA.001.12.2.1]RUZ15316.1 hypothetical protein EN949_32905 [Mesorhizobium sp. M7A.F.Ca.US.007.01.2.1]RUZ44655.1 hypothetical protein EN948_22280 [Mesorhizobium sp. M7A.F.Ca.US.003.02.1.1]RUZ63338.1 hypothetical protein EN950_15725 [Mesorhizobium sp. M7A.F.Ca.US.007.01.1.1]RUZ90112.1 hypothetical protein EN947_06855 [Mesorhizobium sp. M7A.F.Ca.US.003.02.2.1]RVA05134.1 hypothetical protein EN938_10445 [Mesorhizobium sp. M7A.F.Ca.US.0